MAAAEFKLTDLVSRIDEDKLVIPEFQRGFKWRTGDIRKLLESLLLDFPIGAALFWRTQRGTLEFRRIDDVEFGDEGEEVTEVGHAQGNPNEEIDFILDGQQRITSIYKLFPTNLAPSNHELESRFGGLRFFLDLQKLGLSLNCADIDQRDFEDFKDPDVVAAAVVEKRHPDLRKEYRLVTGNKAPQRLSEDHILEVCNQRLWLPLTRGFLENKQSHLQRIRRIANTRIMNEAERIGRFRNQKEAEQAVDAALDRWTDWFTSTFQATLNSKTLTCIIPGNDKEGLARIFETINSTGMSLSVFDLLVARLGTWGTDGRRTNLRQLVQERVERPLLQKFDDEKALGGTASQQLPRALALRVGVELKKGEILRTPKEKFLEHVEITGMGLQAALETFTRHMGIVDDAYLPFKDFIALAAASYSADWDKHRDSVIAFLWALCFVEDWDSSTNDKTRARFRVLKNLLSGNLEKDGFLQELETRFPNFEDVRDATSKTSIIYRTLMAFNLSRGGIDWEGSARTTTLVLEDHHIFPKDWINNNRDPDEDKQIWNGLRDSALNRIFVSKDANGKARALTPPAYLSKLTSDERRLLQLPESFLGPLPTPLKADALSTYLRDRYDIMRRDFLDTVGKHL